MYDGILSHDTIKEETNEERCTCGRYVQNIQECTELLGKRVIAAVSKELQQYQMSVELAAPSAQESDTLFWDVDSRINEDIKPPASLLKPPGPPIKEILLDILTDVNAILLDCLES